MIDNASCKFYCTGLCVYVRMQYSWEAFLTFSEKGRNCKSFYLKLWEGTREGKGIKAKWNILLAQTIISTNRIF